MADENQTDFTVVDKRHTTENATAQPTDNHSQASDSEATQSQSAADDSTANTALPRLTVRDRMLMSIDILHQGAWISMGLIADPATGEIEKDLDAARIAIDCVAFLAEKIQDKLDDATKRELQNLVRDLRVNFVQQSNR